MIDENMTIAEIFYKYPDHQEALAEVLTDIGLGCVGCGSSHDETLMQGLEAHGFEEDAIKKVISDLNSIIS